MNSACFTFLWVTKMCCAAAADVPLNGDDFDFFQRKIKSFSRANLSLFKESATTNRKNISVMTLCEHC